MDSTPQRHGNHRTRSHWRLLGACAQMTEREGVALMLNNFFGVLVNASNGIAMQINIAVSGLVSSFQQAFMPQITKSYAIGDLKSLVVEILISGFCEKIF